MRDTHPTNREGKVVRYFRRPDVSGETACRHCGLTMHVHGRRLPMTDPELVEVAHRYIKEQFVSTTEVDAVLRSVLDLTERLRQAQLNEIDSVHVAQAARDEARAQWTRAEQAEAKLTCTTERAEDAERRLRQAQEEIVAGHDFAQRYLQAEATIRTLSHELKGEEQRAVARADALRQAAAMSIRYMKQTEQAEAKLAECQDQLRR